MAKAFLLLGSNLGNRFQFLQKAFFAIETEIGKVISQSAVYESAPWGFDHKNTFLNQVLIVETKLHPNILLKKNQEIEKKLGRKRKEIQYTERVIDIDILFYDDLIINQDNLTIPHPQICNRMFTIVPLEELNPLFIHPVINKTIKQIKSECTDTLFVKKFYPDL